MAFISWIDNIFALARSPTDAICMLEQVSARLLEFGSLQCGHDSRHVMTCQAYDGDVAEDTFFGWQRTENLNCLGYIISHNCSVAHDLANWKRAAWSAFYKNCGASFLRGQECAQISLLNRMVRTALDSHAVYWPFTTSRAAEVDRLQIGMLQVIIKTKPSSETDAAAYMRNVAISAGVKAKVFGFWSNRFVKFSA